MSDPELGRVYAHRASQSPVVFTPAFQRIMIAGAADICGRRRIRLHAAGCEATHVHLLVSWTGYRAVAQLRTGLKNLLSLFLGRADLTRDRWFSDGGSTKRVITREHFNHLLTTYLPHHAGLFWREGHDLPPVAGHILSPSAGSGSDGSSL